MASLKNVLLTKNNNAKIVDSSPFSAVFLLIWLAIFGTVPLRAQVAYTEPRGIYTVKVPGAQNSATPVRVYIGIQLLPDTQFSGTVQNVSGSSLTFTGGSDLTTLADPERTSYLHVVDGNGDGFITDIEQFTTNGVVCSGDLSLWLQPGTRVNIRPHSNLSDIFGAENTYGFNGGVDADSADNIVLWDPTLQQETVYYFHSTRARWEERGVVADKSKAVIRFPYGLYIVRRSSGTVRIAVSGVIGSDSILLPVNTGANVFSLPINLSASLENLVRTDGEHAVLRGSNATNSDILTFRESTEGRVVGPFYHISDGESSRWLEVGIDDSMAPLAPLELLSTLIIRRTGPPGRLFIKGSIDPPASPVIVLPPDPEPGETQLVGELKLPNASPSVNYTYEVESSTDLQMWAPVSTLSISGGVVRFNLPSGQHRAFYRLKISVNF